MTRKDRSLRSGFLRMTRKDRSLRSDSLRMTRKGRVLARMENPRLETEAQILIQADAQVRVALRREDIVERTHFRFIIGTRADLARAPFAQLAVRGCAISLGREL